MPLVKWGDPRLPSSCQVGPHIWLSSWAVTTIVLGVLGLRGRQAGAPLPPQCFSSTTHTTGAQEIFVGKKRRKHMPVGAAGYSPAGLTPRGSTEHFIPPPLHFGLSALRLRVGGGRGWRPHPPLLLPAMPGVEEERTSPARPLPLQGCDPGQEVTPIGGSTVCSSASRPATRSSLGRLNQGSPSYVSPSVLVLPSAPPPPHLLYMFQKSCRLAWFTTFEICCR